jgi:hypothetical protein
VRSTSFALGADILPTIETWKVYRAFLRSDDAEVIAAELAMTSEAIKQAITSDYEFREAAEAARADRLPAVFEDMDESAKAVWDALAGRDTPDDIRQQALLALSHGGKREQQRLLGWGLMCNHFDLNSALRALKIPQSTYKKWLNDPEFAELIVSIQNAKKQFVEGKLFQLIAHGDSRATIFAAERLMRDSYGQKIEVSGSVSHEHSTLDLSRLSIGLRMQIMEELRDSGMVDPDGLLAIPAESVRRIT